ncbi:MAG TPA: homocysteine S-methyltransferase family protein [Acidimicrobiales bacterium]|nr:homocysteine S-methyltransferase family protein [Acidimicrobiales bacterium]
MAKYRGNLPQLASPTVMLSDSGMETDLIFHEGFDLPLFASFTMLDDPARTDALRNYYRRHVQVARDAHVGFLLEAPTWRASIVWARQLGLDETAVADVNSRAIDLMIQLRDEAGDMQGPLVISGLIGPRDDAYNPAQRTSTDEAERYHEAQIRTLAQTEADLVTALTLTYPAEAIGIARAARTARVPVVISFTVETDGTLPDGSSLGHAIAAVDDATDSYPAYFGINCAHPSHFLGVLDASEEWTSRIKMIRANASRCSHAELDEAETLDDGDPHELSREYAEIRERLPHINVLGGCCGTDVRHMRSIAQACI